MAGRIDTNCVFGVVRHAERADTPFVISRHVPAWPLTQDGQAWPFDPPLSEEGGRAAGKLGAQIQAFAEQCNTTVAVVATSPYLRCKQTAKGICKHLRPDCRLLVDDSLGEIYGPHIMSPTEPLRAARSAAAGPRASSRHIGKWPTWPEDPLTGRLRLATRFLTYLQRSRLTSKNFLLITHADGVGAALSLMPSHAGHIVEHVDYGGMFLGHRSIPRSYTTALRKSMLGSVLSSMFSNHPEENNVQDINRSGTIPEGDHENHVSTDAVTNLGLGWQIHAFDIKMRVLGGADQKFLQSVKAMEKISKFSSNTIKLLLSPLDPQPLGQCRPDQLATTPSSGQCSDSESTKLFAKSASGSVYSSFKNSAASIGPNSGPQTRNEEVVPRDFVNIMRARAQLAGAHSLERPITSPVLMGGGSGATVLRKRGLSMKLSL